MNTIIEPFRIKSVEPIHFTTRAQREELLQLAHNNTFLLHADDVIIDLLTDSGTSAMSSEQWAGIMRGDESYAGSPSFFRFEKTVKELTGMDHITRANIEFSGAEGIDLVCEEGKHPSIPAPFKGNMDVEALEKTIKEKGKENIAMVIMTVTNNSGGGQPVSMENMKAVSTICKANTIPFYIDACRFAENAYFIKMREKGYENHSVHDIAREMFSLADGCTMSAKKDAFANIGGFLALNNDALATQCRNLLVITEGFPTYGGLAGRDLEAIAIGLQEVVDEHYLQYRIRSMEYLTEKLIAANVPVMRPAGGHAVYLDAKAFMDHIPVDQYPGQALVCALYLEGGVRCVEIGSLMFGKYDAEGILIPAALELVRLAIPRRVYTQSHIDYVAEVIIEVYQKRSSYAGLKIVEEAPMLRHFTAKLKSI